MNRLSKSSVLRWMGLVAVVMLLAYVGSYAVLSRRGMAQSKAAGVRGLYFFHPRTQILEDLELWLRDLLLPGHRYRDAVWHCGRHRMRAPLEAQWRG